jgi:hypothetical protein
MIVQIYGSDGGEMCVFKVNIHGREAKIGNKQPVVSRLYHLGNKISLIILSIVTCKLRACLWYPLLQSLHHKPNLGANNSRQRLILEGNLIIWRTSFADSFVAALGDLCRQKMCPTILSMV